MILSPSIVNFLNSIEALKECEQTRMQEFNEMFLYEGYGDSYMHFSKNDQANDSYMVQLQKSIYSTFGNTSHEPKGE